MSGSPESSQAPPTARGTGPRAVGVELTSKEEDSLGEQILENSIDGVWEARPGISNREGTLDA